ncbi:MAG: carboxypeptidase-like regulatory domain-containing protein [Candidatus Neomarinimicrobiota bacterium]
MKRINLTICTIILAVSIGFAATTGKIAGHISDASTGDALQGVNIIVDKTHLGAASDLDGYFVILNVTPGTLILKVFMMGYANVTVNNVVVAINQTTNIDVQMNADVLNMAEVTVVAERPIVEEGVSHSKLNISSETIETMPVTSVNEVIGLQAGVEDLSIRGSSSSETAYVVDGFIMNDERSNVPYSSVALSSVKEITVQTGGFNGEYGNSRSGVINIITEEGDPNHYSGTFHFNYRPPGAKHFGISPYDPDSYFLRPYLDEAVCWTGTSSGEPYEDSNSNGKWDTGESFTDYNGDGTRSYWDAATRSEYPTFMGWNAISEALMADDDPSNDLSPEAAKKLFEWQHRRQGDITKPDYTLDFSVGGPIPGIGKNLGNLRFNFSYRDYQSMFVYPLSVDAYKDNIVRLKLTSDIGDMKLSIFGSYGLTESVSPYNWTQTPTGTVLQSVYSVANLISGEALFVPSYYSPTEIYHTVFGLKLTHIVSNKTFYELSMQNQINRYNTYQTDARDSTLYTPIPGYADYFVDESPYGFYDASGLTSIGDEMRIGGWMNLGRDKSINRTYRIKFDVTSQVNPANQIRAGFETVINNYDIKSFAVNSGMSTWNREQIYEVSPFRLGAYINDQLEFKGLIANLSLRLDYSNPNTKYFILDPYDNYFKSGQGNLIEENAPAEDADPELTLSPRLGISHPISATSKLYFNYGHYRSEASSSSRFSLQREYNGQITDVGNPNLQQEKTVAYEIGYSQSLFDQYLINLAGYYKNVTNQVGWVVYESINTAVDYVVADNNQYEDIRGAEITIEKRSGDWLTGFVNYTYMINTYGYFGLLENYENPTKMREYLKDNEYQEKPVPRPYARAGIDLHSPDRYGLRLGGFYPLGGITLNILASWKTGSYSTYNPNNQAGIINNVQWVDSYSIKLRLTKNIQLKNADMQFYVDVSNALDTKFLSYTGFASSQDYDDYLASLHFEWEDGIQKGKDRLGTYRDFNVDYVPMREISYNPLDPMIQADDLKTGESGAVYKFEGYPITGYQLDEDDNIIGYTYDYTQTATQYIGYDYSEDGWHPINKSAFNKLLENKAYIDMPNIQSMTFHSPREIKIGIQISF